MMSLFDMINIGTIAAAASFVCSVLIVLSKNWHGKHSMDHDTSGVQKYHIIPVPRVGGIAVMFGIICALIITAFTHPNLGKALQIGDTVVLLLASCPIFFAGTIEDLTKRVSANMRLLASFLSPLLASWLLGATADALDIWGVDHLMTIGPIAVVATAFVVAGGINAINIIDGFHGLAASAVIIMLTALGFLAWRSGDTFVMQLAILSAAATFGFLLVNYPTGRLFIGDGGAYLLGFLTSEVAILLLVRNPAINAWQVLAICGYPIIEVSYSIYRKRVVRKMSASVPDRLHFHMLIYRRLICRWVAPNQRYPWLRNALVACVVSTWVASASIAALLFGNTIPGGVAIVVCQLVLYLAIHARLVWGRWSIGLSTPAIAEGR